MVLGPLIDRASLQVAGNDGIHGSAASQGRFTSGEIEPAPRFLGVMTADAALAQDCGAINDVGCGAQHEHRQERDHAEKALLEFTLSLEFTL